MKNAINSDGKGKYRVAVAQLDSGIDRASNFEKIESMTAEASDNGVKLICFPEMVNILSKKLTCRERAELLDGESVRFFKALARKYNIHIAC